MSDPVYDGDQNFLGGQDASKAPDKVAQNTYFSGINLSTQNGVASPRWGFKKRKLDFSNLGSYRMDNLQLRSYEDLFYQGRSQALIPYSIGSTYYLIWIVSGVMFLINQETFIVEIISINDGSQLNENAARIYWEDATKYLVIHDYKALPVILQNGTARRSNNGPPFYEVPVSTLGAFNQDRLLIVNAGNEFTLSDPVGVGFPDAPLSFTEISTQSTGFTGQIFSLSTNYGNDPITAAVFLPVVDTSTGIGPALLATKNAIWSYQTQNPRSQWTGGQFGSIFVNNSGIIGARSFTVNGSDVFYQSSDGQIRSLSMSRDEQGGWSKTPLSREIQNWLKFWDESLMKYSVLSYFKNKIFVTVNPFRMEVLDSQQKPISDYAHGGLAVLELDNVSTLSEQSSPCWNGLWKGVFPMELSTNNQKMFIASKDNHRNELYEVTPDQTYDFIDGAIRLVDSRMYTRMYNFQSPSVDKKIDYVELELNNISGPFDVEIRYRPSHGTLYAKWGEYSIDLPWRTCEKLEDEFVNGYGGVSFKRLNFGSPIDEDAENPVTQDTYEDLRKVQLQIDISGIYWELNQITLQATQTPQNQQLSEDSSQWKAVGIPLSCSDDWITKGADLCLTQPKI